MSEQEKLIKAQELFSFGKYSEARRLLEEITTKNPSIRMNVLSTFIGVLDHVSENDKLLMVANEGIVVATNVGNATMRSYFLGKKCCFLMSELSMMMYRQKNLILAARVFEWIGFSLQRDKEEYETLSKKREQLEREIDLLLATVIREVQNHQDHDFKGHQFSTIGDVYSSKYLADKLDFQEGGKLKSKIANFYFVRRWNLDRYLYRRDVRRRIDQSRDNCIRYFQMSINEFGLAGKKSEQAHAIYNLAAKMQLFNRFRYAKRLLTEAREIAESINEKRLLEKITELEVSVADKNRNIRDYVSEMGLDMP